jgi:glycosyltransferase involved in cell wall biosynthesis
LAGNQFSVVEVIPLGGDVDVTTANHRSFAPINKAYHQRFLSVGTIEPRKNYQFILNAFNELWAMPDNEALTWTIVGRVGWNSHNLYAELKNHPEFGRRLKLFVEADDKQLIGLYEESSCMIAGSIDEGYGLPVVEAIEHNCTVLLSDIEIFREFNLVDAHYFLLDSTVDLIEKIQSQKNI